MDVVSVSSLHVGSLLWQPRPSVWVVTVVCKATYSLLSAQASLAADLQEAPNEQDEHWEDDPLGSVTAPSDLVPVKPRPEVMLVGHAYAPGRTPVTSLVVRLVVGDVDKAISVSCDRSVGPDGSVYEGRPFARMALRYERAGGGPGTLNPAGMRSDARDAEGRRLLPNLQPARRTPQDDPNEPVGFGPIAGAWPSRAEKLGRHAAGFSPDSLRDHALPEGMDLEFFNQAPRDQQLSVLRETERIVLENLNADHPRLVTTLPGLRPAAFVDRGRGGQASRLSLRADTLLLDTDRATAQLTWRGQLPLEHPSEKGRVLVGIEPAGHELTWAEVERQAKPGKPARPAPPTVHKQTMTFVPGVHAWPAGAGEDAGDPKALPQRAILPFQSGAGGAEASPPSAGRPAPAAAHGLPFQRTSVSAPPPAPSSQSRMDPPRSLSEAPWSAPATQPTGLSESSSAWGPATAPGPVAPAGQPSGSVESRWSSRSLDPSPRESVPVPVALPALATPLGGPLGRSTEGPQAGALGASNAAVGTPWSVPRRDLRSVSLVPELAPEPTPSSGKPALRLVWLNRASVPRMRRVARWKPLLEALEDRPLDRDLDDPGAEQDPMVIEEQREVFEILARGDATDAAGVDDALAGAVRDDGRFAPPLVLLAAELDFPFDELETLKAAVSTATPLATPLDEGLRAALEIARELLKTPGLSASPQVCEGLTARLREALAKDKPTLPADYLDVQSERVLLAGRHYQKRALLGEDHLRVLLRTPGADQPLIGYVPAAVAKSLPMFRRFRGRLVAEVHLTEEQFESQPSCLRVLALLRAVDRPQRRAG